jgi:AcrR family transcriptional regulator
MNTVAGTREAGMALTRERILDVATREFTEHFYDEVTLRGVATAAGVALGTVVNHFGSKEGLFAAGVEHVSAQMQERRAAAAAGDVAGAVAALVGDYERTGDVSLRLLAVEDRIPAVRAAMDYGRQDHEQWVQRMFPASLAGLAGGLRRRRVAQLVAATDVYTWKLFRRDRGFSQAETAKTMQELVERLHPSKETP